MADQARGSNLRLFMADEEQYGKPNVTYDSSKKSTVEERSPAGVADVVFSADVSGNFKKGGWVALYTGDYGGVVQLKQIKSLKNSMKTVTLTTKLQFPVAKGDTMEVVTDFNPSEIWPVPGIVSFNPALEIGSIPDESLSGSGGGTGERTPGSPRRGNVNGEGGSLVVQPGTEGFARLLRHAVGRNVDYSGGYVIKTAAALSTAINLAAGYDPGAKELTLDAITNGDNGDWVMINDGTALKREPVKIAENPAANKIKLDLGTRIRHEDDETVKELNITEGETLLTKEIRKSNLPPGMTLYAYHTDLDILEVISGVRVTSMSLSAGTAEETVKATFNLISKAGQLESLAALPFTTSNTVSHSPYTNAEVSLTEAGTRVIGLQSVDLTIENEITGERSMDGTGTISAAPEDIGDVSLSMTAQLFNAQRFLDAIEENKKNYAIKLEYTGSSDGHAIEFNFPQSVVSGNQLVPVTGGGGITASFTLTSGVDSAKDTQLYVTVKSHEVRIW